MATEQDAIGVRRVVVKLEEERPSFVQVESYIDGVPVVETGVRLRG